MFTLHIANKNYSSWSLRPWLLMEVLNIPFAEIIHPFPETNAWHEYRHFAPNGKVPCLQHDTLTVWDSLAITEYLAEQYSDVWPQDRLARAWARSAAAEMHSGFQSIRNHCSMNCAMRIQMHTLLPELQKDIARLDELWCEGLEKFGGPFLAGKHFSAVDAFFAPIAFRAQTYHLQFSAAGNEYFQRILALPAMREWYDAGIAETWREPAHEQEALAAGILLNDFRL